MKLFFNVLFFYERKLIISWRQSPGYGQETCHSKLHFSLQTRNWKTFSIFFCEYFFHSNSMHFFNHLRKPLVPFFMQHNSRKSELYLQPWLQEFCIQGSLYPKYIFLAELILNFFQKYFKIFSCLIWCRPFPPLKQYLDTAKFSFPVISCLFHIYRWTVNAKFC